MSTQRIVFFGGNGHCAARLLPARAAADRLASAGQIESLEIIEAP